MSQDDTTPLFGGTPDGGERASDATRPGTPAVADDPPVGGDDPTLQGEHLPMTTATEASLWPPVRRLGTDGRYHLEERIAAGGAATVWRAYDEHLDRSVAVKILHPHLVADPDTIRRFERESRNAARLHHPNAIRIFDSGRVGDVVYLVMEYVDGPTLKDVLAAHGALPTWEVVAAIGEQVAAVLTEAHGQGLIHRDIKPANILLTSDGMVKVVDFGIAKALHATTTELTAEGMTVGTASYIAPEQYIGEDVDHRADLYALGIVLYECLTGRSAFAGDTPQATAAARLTQDLIPARQVRVDVDRRLDDLVMRCTRRERADRFPDAATVAHTLRSLIGNRVPQELTSALLASSPPPRPRRPEFPDVDPEAITDPGMQAAHQRSRTRLIIAFLAGIALTVLAIAIAGDVGGDGDGSIPTSSGTPLAINAAADYDPPPGDGAEHPGEVPRAFDQNLSTAWTTETYRGSPRFGDAKPGVGFYVDLGEGTRVAAFEVDAATGTAEPGLDLELYAVDVLPAAADGLLGWGQPIGSLPRVTDTGRLALDAPVTARYVLVWLTSLPPTEPGLYRAELAEIRFFGPVVEGVVP